MSNETSTRSRSFGPAQKHSTFLKEIRRKLESFRVSPEDNQSFLDRLSRENQWSRGFTERVYREYLRFLYLAVASEHSVTPSEQVDQVWHLHLCYSKSYWKDLCEDVLRRKLHHNPTTGGLKERARFHHQYQLTLESYRNAFEEAPPEDIWPSAETRFARAERFARVNLRHSYVVPKRRVHFAALGVASIFLLSGCQTIIDEALEGDPFSIGVIAVAVLMIGWIVWKLRGRGGDGSGCGGFFGCGSECDSGCGGCGGD